ncbi:MAG: choice-of-anchor A family protein, partial [Lachnospiraceae bacterium]|nr:choice-of-anchor A family protein [Lachnospiraceae bacterium]
MKRWLRASVALLALIAMLSENTYSVYAAMDGYTSPDGSVQEFEQEIEVDTKEAETPTQAVDDPAESADEVEAAVADEADDPEEAAEEDDTEVRNTGRRSAGVVSASVEAFDDYLAAEGVDDFTLYINTDEMNDDDKFSLEFTEDAVPFMDDVLFGTMTKEDGGIYNISDLDGEYFEIWVDSVSDGMEVKYEIRDDDYPQITLVSEPEPEVEKSLEVDGNVVYGEGYRELHIDIDTEELPDDTYYALHIDTDADVEYEGEALSGNVIETISNTTEEIYLSNLDKEYFELYITGENTDEVGAAYYVDSVENGALRISLNMDGTSGEGSAKITDVKATIVDQFGDEIGEDYTDMDLPEFEDDVLTLDDPEKAPVENVEIEAGPAKVIKYTYEESKLDKKVITALKREEVTDAKTGETGYAYSFTEDGQTWKPIREDTTVYFSYSDGKKSVYEYEDGDISVKATLQHANAIPDDAEFVVTRITPETEGYNYEAYMQAANENAALIDKEYDPESEGERFTADNSMLYDIAFVYTDEEGNKVEYQPAEGAVKIEIGFKKNQMEEDLGIENAEDIAIVHMPLSDSVKEETATTAEATDISASDISVEVVDNQARGEEELAFNLSDFSTVFLANISGLKKGTDRDFEGVLGDARFYGVTANTVQKVVHMDTNFATKYLKGLNGDITAGAYTGVNGGAYIIADSDNGSLQINGKAVKIKTTNAVKNRIQKSSDSVWDINEKSYWEGIVNGMISYVTAQSKTINDSENTYAYSTLLNDKLIDITSKGAGTYYIQADNIQGQQPMFERLGGELRIKKNSNQTIVFVFTKEDVHIHRYQIQNADKSTEWISSATQNETIDPIVRTVIFNMYNAKNLYFEAGTAGTFLAPQATVQSLNGTSSGWIVCNYFKNTSGEWHCVYQDMPDELATETVIKGYKYVNNTTPKSNEKFWFDLYAYGNQPDGTPNGTLIASAQNNGELIQFPAIKYDKYYGGNPDVYGYKIVERADANNGYEEDKAIYIVKHNVTKVGNQITATVRYIADKTDGTEKQLGTDYNKIKFYNFTGTPYDFPVKKLFYKNDGTNWNAKDYKDWLNDWLRKNGIGYGEDWPDGATFTFRMEKFDGGQANAGNNIKMGPLPAATKVEGADYCEITLTKNNQTGTFGTVNFPLKAYDDGALTQYYRTPDGVEVWNRTYMYKIYEVVPDDAHKVPGVTYSDKVIYLKIFVDCMKNSLGQYTMNVHDKISLSNTNGSCYDNPGPAEFVNHYQGGSLTVQKIAKDKAGNPVDGDKDFYVVVYRKEGNKKIYYGTDGKEYNSVHVETVKGNSSLTFYGLKVDKQYYVFETDANGNVIADSDDYTVTYEGVDVQNKLNL